jgi:hypothetical protein
MGPLFRARGIAHITRGKSYVRVYSIGIQICLWLASTDAWQIYLEFVHTIYSFHSLVFPSLIYKFFIYCIDCTSGNSTAIDLMVTPIQRKKNSDYTKHSKIACFTCSMYDPTRGHIRTLIELYNQLLSFIRIQGLETLELYMNRIQCRNLHWFLLSFLYSIL